jgi:hypothetical protein
MVLHRTIGHLSIQTGHVASDHGHLLSDAHHLTVESHPGVDGHGLEIGDVEGARNTAHEFPEARPSKGTECCGGGHVEYDPSSASVHDIYQSSVWGNAWVESTPRHLLFKLDKLGAMLSSYVTVPSRLASTSSKFIMTSRSKS